MTLSRRKVDRLAALVFIGLCLIVGSVCVLAFWPIVRSAFTSAHDIHVSDPERAVLEARALVADRERNPEKYGPFTTRESLPESLRMPGLHYAKVHSDHVDLVVPRIGQWVPGSGACGIGPTGTKPRDIPASTSSDTRTSCLNRLRTSRDAEHQHQRRPLTRRGRAESGRPVAMLTSFRAWGETAHLGTGWRHAADWTYLRESLSLGGSVGARRCRDCQKATRTLPSVW